MNRREFLKLLSLLPAGLYLPGRSQGMLQTSGNPNILILVFDSWSASNTSLYGYPRKTTPNIDRLAEHAIVYHNHYASGHYTYPSTASLLTGVLPWTHQGYWDNAAEEIFPQYTEDNLFSLFDSHHRFAYSNNALASSLLKSMSAHVDKLTPIKKLAIPNNFWYQDLFSNDSDISLVSWIQVLEALEDHAVNSVFLSRLYSHFQARLQARMSDLFPRGVPAISKKDGFLLETSIDWIVNNLDVNPEPFLGYVHLLPPHSPYNTRGDFYDHFLNDGYQPTEKPLHPFGQKAQTYQVQAESRRTYDEYLLYVDAEFNRLMETLKSRDLLDNTILVLTSDHGELFERGIPEHLYPSFHQPLMHVPLLIFMPGLQERIDIHDLTTTVDLLPTLLHLTGKPKRPETAGLVLPPFNPDNLADRALFSVDFRHSEKNQPLTDGTIMVRQGDHKITFHFGSQKSYEALEGQPLFELFNLAEDPEEMTNLFDPADPLSRSFIDLIMAELGKNNLELASAI